LKLFYFISGWSRPRRSSEGGRTQPLAADQHTHLCVSIPLHHGADVRAKGKGRPAVCVLEVPTVWSTRCGSCDTGETYLDDSPLNILDRKGAWVDNSRIGGGDCVGTGDRRALLDTLESRGCVRCVGDGGIGEVAWRGCASTAEKKLLEVRGSNSLAFGDPREHRGCLTLLGTTELAFPQMP
jgi:hypothetical protein